MNKTDKIVEMLQEAFDNDPDAIQSIMEYRVPANQKTCDHPTIAVNSDHQVGALGLINGILETIEEDRIAIVFDDNNKFIGFTNYEKLDKKNE